MFAQFSNILDKKLKDNFSGTADRNFWVLMNLSNSKTKDHIVLISWQWYLKSMSLIILENQGKLGSNIFSTPAGKVDTITQDKLKKFLWTNVSRGNLESHKRINNSQVNYSKIIGQPLW